MKKIVFALIIVCLFASTGWGASKSEDYVLQERCGKTAHDSFKEGYGNGYSSDSDGTHWIWTQRNHYNKKLNKCFILLHGYNVGKDNYTVSESLYDINEEKEYGDFDKFNDKGIMHIDCKVLDKFCESETEWEVLIKPYMEE